ncbi:hypothetical protein SOPP22_10235 [Shewanella sp. OPT22]|nr:hypothetical protein SOPP22_10235 [Shewanella sp. OPT22]
MNVCVIITVTGEGDFEIVNQLAAETCALNAKWMTSKVSRIGEQFAALILVDIESEKLGCLEDAFRTNYPQLTFSYSEPKVEAAIFSEPIQVTLNCEDRSGLTREINDLLTGLEVEVEHINTIRAPVSGLGCSVYEAKMTLRLPTDVTQENLVHKLEQLNNKIRISCD